MAKDDVCAKPISVGPNWASQVKAATPAAPAQSQPANSSPGIHGGASIMPPATSAGITHKNALNQQDVIRLKYALDGTVRTISYALAQLNLRGADYMVAERQLHLAGMARCPYCDRWFEEEYRKGYDGLTGACYLCRIGEDAY